MPMNRRLEVSGPQPLAFWTSLIQLHWKPLKSLTIASPTVLFKACCKYILTRTQSKEGKLYYATNNTLKIELRLRKASPFLPWYPFLEISSKFCKLHICPLDGRHKVWQYLGVSHFLLIIILKHMRIRQIHNKIFHSNVCFQILKVPFSGWRNDISSSQ